MLGLRQIDAAERALVRSAAAWRRLGWDVELEMPPRNGVWLQLADAAGCWQGWLRPRDWLAHAVPQLAELAVSSGVDALVAQWLHAVEHPLELPMPELAYQRLRLGEPVAADALPQRPLLRVMAPGGPLWLERLSEVEAAAAPPLSGLSWPLRFVVGDSRVRLALLDRVGRGDVLLIHELAREVRCHDKTLGFYRIDGEDITMEWQEQQDMEDETEAVHEMGQLPVRLEFVLHRDRLTLGELQDMCRGHLLRLPVDAERQVEVRANSALIGRGELVQLDGQLGVEVTEWLGVAANVK
ncbi:YscQ/HrcQ family type III secretion apparatus protein [Burkholderia ambifaria]|uniref:YscQ/HrcQ family type III secretion apparatus protein n=1 Tax=Burkholderia ambifaria TaxID=152480 RepID=UPI00158977D9|nr:YscQ/HrcQ family type III secretion apparatus protein [Burkholderia ambifaria]